MIKVAFLFALLLSIADGASISVAMTAAASASLPECQTTTLTMTSVVSTFTCTPIATSVTATMTRTVSPTGPASPCFVISACGAGITCTGGSNQCSVTLTVNPALGTLDYETTAPTFTYVAMMLMSTSAAGGYVGTGVYNVTIPVQDCNEAPTFTTVAYNSQLPEYNGTVTSFAGFIGSVDVRDPDTYSATFGSITMAIISVKNTATNTGIMTTPFYFNVTTGNNHIVTYLSYNTLLCPVAQQATCLSYFQYVTPQPIYEVTMTATDGGGLITTATYTFAISRVYLPPVLTDLPAIAAVGELQGFPYNIFSATATSPQSLAVTFNIVAVYPPSGTTYFQMLGTCSAAVGVGVYCQDVALGATVTSSTFNYYSVNQYNLTIWATVTSPSGRLTSSSSLLVNITLVNRQPVLTVGSSSLTIGEDQTSGMCFWTITANDREGNPVIYTWIGITPSTGGALNFYNNNSLLCFTAATKIGLCCSWIFDQTSQPSYTMSLLTADAFSTLAASTFTFTLSIQYRNKPPVITGSSNATMSLWECFTSGTANTLSATDPENNALTFAIGQPQPSNALMFFMTTITSTPSGATPAKARLDYLSPPPLNSSITPLYLNVTVTDNQWTVQTALIVNVKYCDTLPRFTNLATVITLQENTIGFNTSMFTVSSYDKENDLPSYWIKLSNGSLSTNDSTGYFFINTATGAVGYNLPSYYVFDAYNIPAYSLTIAVTNTPSNGPYGLPVTVSSVLTISIVPNDRPPKFIKPDPTTGGTVTVLDNATVTYVFYVLNGTDREGDPLFYNITAMYPSYNPVFRVPLGLPNVEFNTQYANSTPPIDFFLVPIYYIVMVIYDQFTIPTSTATLTVSIIRTDKPPVWTSLPATVNVREDVTLAADLVTIGARDKNQQGYVISYSMLSITPSSGTSKFYFNTATKAFGYSANPGFNYQTQSSYQAVFVADNTVLKSTSAVNIHIVQRSSPQSSSGSYANTITLDETQSYASLIWDLRSSDNSSLSLSYGLISVTPYTGIFTVTQDGLVKIQDNPGLDYQKTPRYILAIKVVSSNLPPKTTTFTLTVSVQDEPSLPTLSNLPNLVTMSEGIPGSGAIFTPICIDKDSRTLTYSQAVQPTAAADYFSISSSTGVLSTTSTARVTYKSTPNIYITITCSNSVYSTSGTLTINVQYTSYWSVTQPASTQAVVSTSSTTASSDCANCLTTTQIGAIAGSICGALALAGLAYGLAKLLQNQAQQNGTLDNIRPVSPPPYDKYNNY